MSLLTKEVQNGSIDGKEVWVCQYNQPDLNKKPLRNVPPTKCIVVSNDELPKNKTVYYSKSHFRPIGNNGKVLSKIISPVDNTGFRFKQGNPINTFYSESECIERWNIELEVVHKRLTEKQSMVVNEIAMEIIKIEGAMK